MSTIFHFFVLRNIGGINFPIELVDIILKLLFKSKKIFAGYQTSFFIYGNKTYSWGKNEHGQLAQGPGCYQFVSVPEISGIKNAKKIVFGVTHTVVVTTHGVVYASGSNKYKQLGCSTFPYIKTDNLQFMMNDTNKIACTMYGTILSNSKGEIFVCGKNTYGELIYDSPDEIIYPLRRLNIVIPRIRKIICCEYTMVITTDSNVYMWRGGQLEKEFYKLHIPGVKSIRFMKLDVYILLDRGDLHCVQGMPHSNLTVQTLVKTHIKNIKLGENNLVAMSTNGDVYVSGYEIFGVYREPSDKLLHKICTRKIRTIAWGWTHVMMLTYDDKLYVCGRNGTGELGIGRKSQSRVYDFVELCFNF